jgi:hypothetical protein
MPSSEDPIVAGLAAALQSIFERGVVVTPVNDGWVIRLADASSRSTNAAHRPNEMGRSW